MTFLLINTNVWYDKWFYDFNMLLRFLHTVDFHIRQHILYTYYCKSCVRCKAIKIYPKHSGIRHSRNLHIRYQMFASSGISRVTLYSAQHGILHLLILFWRSMFFFCSEMKAFEVVANIKQTHPHTYTHTH